jgi:diacylglycerol kinase (ATP)
MAETPLRTAETAAYPEVRCKRLLVVVNPASGKDQPFLNTLDAVFRAAGIDWDLRITKQAGDGARLAREGVNNGADVVAAFGGDGTVSEVAVGLKDTHVPLAILPGGTGNVMSSELGIPRDLGLAARLIATGVLRPVDMGQAGDRFFILRATIGWSAEVAAKTSQEDKNRQGILAYTISTLKSLPEGHSIPFTLNLDGQIVEASATTCYIANSGNLGQPGFTLSPDINVSDGRLDVFMIDGEYFGALLSMVANATGIVKPRYHWQVRQVTVTADPSQKVEMDGEIIAPTPLTVRVIPNAVQIVVPPP